MKERTVLILQALKKLKNEMKSMAQDIVFKMSLAWQKIRTKLAKVSVVSYVPVGAGLVIRIVIESAVLGERASCCMGDSEVNGIENVGDYGLEGNLVM